MTTVHNRCFHTPSLLSACSMVRHRDIPLRGSPSSTNVHLFIMLVVGHTHCGGAAACMSAARTPSTSRSPTPRPAAGSPRSRLSPHISSRRPLMRRSVHLWRRTCAHRWRTCPRPRWCRTRGKAERRCCGYSGRCTRSRMAPIWGRGT
ncbi:hypothetical protein FIBSPDRAFT_349597 [Athelia psychrophila]|uniref:Uncharacterized protein n=1 Tax=Athelia psychrophila TaxID=1759441 RepID=A0A167VZQ1_9AGAM|nr:hypothetical protein FIBSPDRAFT_349597 [Fibularhizoctonia sp. CBS 109695]